MRPASESGMLVAATFTKQFANQTGIPGRNRTCMSSMLRSKTLESLILQGFHVVGVFDIAWRYS
jgi:hypothetical protein